jgi:hypothetical protein
MDFDYVPRNSTHEAWWVLGWDGYTLHGQHSVEVPNGTYWVRLSVQKALGDDDDPEHWEHWDSPRVTLFRPAKAGTQPPEEKGRDAGDRRKAARPGDRTYPHSRQPGEPAGE